MHTGRLEAFSDGVIAILITIMVLEFRIPHETDWAALAPLIPTFLTYVLSFVFLGIYWNNHHHLMHATQRVTGSILWANSHLLFWLSLVPFVTGWMGENHLAQVPTAAYGFVLFMAGIAYWILQRLIVAHEGPESVVGSAVGSDPKGMLSLLLYLLAIPLAFVNEWASYAIYVSVALIWLVPDKRLERRLREIAK